MLEALEKRIRDVQIRCSANLLIDQTALALITAGTIGALAVLIEKLFGVEIINNLFAISLTSVCIAGIGLIYAIRQPTRMYAALLIDERKRKESLKFTF